MNLRIFAALVVESWRQLDDAGIVHDGVLTRGWLRAFELVTIALTRRTHAA